MPQLHGDKFSSLTFEDLECGKLSELQLDELALRRILQQLLGRVVEMIVLQAAQESGGTSSGHEAALLIHSSDVRMCAQSTQRGGMEGAMIARQDTAGQMKV